VSVDQVVATTEEELAELSGWVHDVWFDLDDLHLAPEDAEVTLPLFGIEEHRSRFLGLRYFQMSDERIGTLVVRNVRAVHVEDEARVRYYDIGHLTAVEDGGVVQLHANIPLRVDFQVDAVNVQFSSTEAYDKQPWG
jgi:hypothetical protein